MRKDTKSWIEWADTDLRIARVLYDEKIYDYSLFHSQQAVEKYLKSFLIEKMFLILKFTKPTTFCFYLKHA